MGTPNAPNHRSLITGEFMIRQPDESSEVSGLGRCKGVSGFLRGEPAESANGFTLWETYTLNHRKTIGKP